MSAPRIRVSTRAPGKLFLLGEYAVLYGGPALVQAVDRYVEVTATSGDEGSTLRFSSTGSAMAPLVATCQERSVHYSGVESGHELITTIVDALAHEGILRPKLGNIDCTIDSRALFYNERKLGLGSSGAVTHALVAALVAIVNELASDDTKTLPPDFVFNVHRAFQKGRGSGADLGAGLVGGCYSFRRAREPVMPILRRVTAPDQLHTLFVWAGKPASTSDALQDLATYQNRHPGAFTAALTPLLELAEEGCLAFESGDAAGFVGICEQYGHNLSEFGRTVGVDIMSQAHRDLQKIAAACGVAYKPSGAGTGDFGVGYSMDINALSYFERRARHAGFTPMTMGLGEPCGRI